MSTRCTLHFRRPEDGPPSAIIYRHSDGYPDSGCGVIADLKRFFNDVELQTNDHRYADPSYLAAKFVVWQAAENACGFKIVGGKMGRVSKEPLDFLGVGIEMEDPGDIEYRYHIICGTSKRPRVICEDTRSGKKAEHDMGVMV